MKERERRAILMAHNESRVLFQMRAGQVWRVRKYNPDLQWGELPKEIYFILIAPRAENIPGEYEIMRSRLKFGEVAVLQMAGVGARLAALRKPSASLHYENWSAQLLTNQGRPLIFEPEPFSWAPWRTDVKKPG
jgi:hypothetical protein